MTLTDAEVADVAAQLAMASDTRTAVDQLVHEPGDVDEGYRIQLAGHRLHADELLGWKAGCTSEAAQQMLTGLVPWSPAARRVSGKMRR